MNETFEINVMNEIDEAKVKIKTLIEKSEFDKASFFSDIVIGDSPEISEVNFLKGYIRGLEIAVDIAREQEES